MKPSTVFRYQAIEPNGVVSGALANFRQGRTNGVVYTDKELKIPARNPYPANAAGRMVLYMPVGEEYEVTITRPDGVQIDQFVHTAMPSTGVQIVEREVPVEVIREVPTEDRETRAKLEATEAKLQALRDELNASRVRSETAVEAIPPELQDLFRETDAHGDKAAELLRRYNELTNKIMMNIATDTERKMQERLHGGLSWLQRKAVEVI